MHDDFLNHFPQEGGGKFLKGQVLADNPHEFLGVNGGRLRLVQFGLQSGGAVFQMCIRDRLCFTLFKTSSMARSIFAAH